MKRIYKLLILFGVALIGFFAGYFFRQSLETPTPTSEPVIVEPSNTNQTNSTTTTTTNTTIEKDGVYDTKDEVALYIHTYGVLPQNFMTKKEAREHGWKGGSLHLVVEGKCIGGDVFNNFEGELPSKEGRTYYECDIGTLKSKKRGKKRIIYSNDGLVYYTGDHYETFELLYGEE